MHKFPMVIATDLDGTLFGKDGQTVPSATFSFLTDYEQQGGFFVPVTGRAADMVPLHQLPPVSFLISSNGGMITDIHIGETLRLKSIAPSKALTLWHSICSECTKYDAVIEFYDEKSIVVEKGILHRLDAYKDRLPSFHYRYFLSGQGRGVESIEEYLQDAQTKVVKINFPGKSLLHCPWLKEKILHMDLFSISSDGMNVELNEKGCNKGEALEWLCQRLQVSTGNVAAFGDGDNDLSMLRSVGWGIAMANASARVKAATQYLTLSNEEEGVLHFLQNHFPFF